MAERVEEEVVAEPGDEEFAGDSSVDPEPRLPEIPADAEVVQESDHTSRPFQENLGLGLGLTCNTALEQKPEETGPATPEEREQTTTYITSPLASSPAVEKSPVIKRPETEEVEEESDDEEQTNDKHTTLASVERPTPELYTTQLVKTDTYADTLDLNLHLNLPTSEKRDSVDLVVAAKDEDTTTTDTTTTAKPPPSPGKTETTTSQHELLFEIAEFQSSRSRPVLDLREKSSSRNDVDGTMAEVSLQVQVQSPPSAPQQMTQSGETTTPAPSMGEKSASCKYRWGKVVPTNSKRVIFFCSAHPNEPVFLHWSPQQEAYYSEEAKVVCGDYAGHVIVEGKTYPVDPFSVRSYTFEVDLFLKEDVIEDEVATTNSVAEELKFQQQQQQQQQGPVDTYRDISSSAFTSAPTMEESGSVDDSGIRHNNKYEDLLRQQLQHKESLDASLENELMASQKTEQVAGGSGTKRLTPVGDIDKEPFQDGYSSVPLGDSGAFDSSLLARTSDRHTPQNTYSGSASDLRQDFEMDRHLLKSSELLAHSLKSSELGISRHSMGDSPAGDTGFPKSSSRTGGDFSGGLGSGHVTPKPDSYESVGGNRPGSASHTSTDRRVDDVLGSSGSHSSSARQSLTREAVGDVLGSEAILANTTQAFASSSPRYTPERDMGLSGSTGRSTPQREGMSAALRGSQERLYGSQELTSPGDAHSLPGSRPGSQLGSRPGSQQASRAQSLSHSLTSLTSEQELAQILDTNNSHPMTGKRSLTRDTHPDEASSLPPIMRDRDRPSSLPAHSTQSFLGPDKRTYTPDLAWSSFGGGGMGDTGFQRELPPRGSSRPPPSSRTSSRTMTPVSAGFDREDSAKVRDLEETVATLRKLLSSREQEVHELTAHMRDLKEINQSLKSDLDHARSRRSTPAGPEDLQCQYEQLLQEKEILAGEVVKLRDRLESTRGTGVDSFSAQSSVALQRRIDELEAHVRDLRFSNDSTGQKLLRSEKKVRELTDENNKLRSSQDPQDDKSGGRYGERHQQIETQQLREDVRALRDRNYSLQEEILRLKEGGGGGGKDPYHPHRSLMDFPRTAEPLRDFPGRAPLMTSSARGDERLRQRSGVEPSGHEGSGLHLSDLGRSKHLSSADPPGSPGRRLDRSYGSDSFPTVSARDPRDRSFGSDQGTRDGLRETISYSHSRLENGDRERSGEKHVKYRDYRGERDMDMRRTSNRYDLPRSRPDGEVSEKVHASDAGRYGPLSAEKLRSFDRERERERVDSKASMSAERLRLLEEAERNRERRVHAASSGGGGGGGRRGGSADNPISSKDFYHSVKNRFGPRRDYSAEKYSSPLHGSLPSSLCTDKTSLSDLFATNDTRHRKSEGHHSDDSDSTAVLMSFDVKADPFSGHREKEKSSYSERSRSQDAFFDRPYLADRAEQEKQRDREFRGGHRETNGDDSDTATDILLSVEPGKMGARSPPRRRRRRSSIGDDASLSSLSDGEEPQDSLRRRSKSADPKGKKGSSAYGQTTSLRAAASSDLLGGGKTMTLTSGFRTVTPQPLATQHNKTALLQQQHSSLASSLTQGLRPFAPRSPADVRSDDVVKFSRQGGKLSQGTVKFVGHLPGRSDVYLGVELYKEEGKHDGTFEGVRYFKCKPNKGVFVAFNKVVMAWAPN